MKGPTISFRLICTVTVTGIVAIGLVVWFVPDSLKPSVAQALGTMFGAFVAALVVMWQVQGNALAALDAKKIEKQRETCLSLY